MKMKYFAQCVAFLLMAVLVASCSKKKTEEQLWSEAAQFENEENFDKALTDYEEIYTNFPQGKHAEEALEKAAFIYYNNFKDYQKAIAQHEKLIEEYPDSKFVPQARFMIGFIYANDLKDYDNARLYYNQFLEKHPDNELVASVKWELDHLGEDVNEQLQDLFGEAKTNGDSNAKK